MSLEPLLHELEQLVKPVQRLVAPTRGHTMAARTRVIFDDGTTAFAKMATDAHTAAALRREAALYRRLRRPWHPRLIAFHPDEPVLLVLEDLSGAHWPPPWPDDLSELWSTLEEVADTPPPEGLERLEDEGDLWTGIAEDPAPVLALGVIDAGWLERNAPLLSKAAAEVSITGDRLVHQDLDREHVCLSRRGLVLTDWRFAALGNRWVDVATVTLDLLASGRSPAESPLPDQPAWAAQLAAKAAIAAAGPPPPWAIDGRLLKATNRRMFEVAVRWACESLDLEDLPRAEEPPEAPTNPTHHDGWTRITYRGRADRVRLATFMPRFPEDVAFDRTAPETWRLDLRLPSDARIEYLIEVEHGGYSTRFLDPDNPETSANPFGENSVATGPGYRPPDWLTAPVFAHGRITEHRVASRRLGERRRLQLYSPPGALRSTPLPLLLVHDGTDHRRFADLIRALDALIAAGAMAPIRAALLDPKARHEEYVGAERQAAHLVEEVVPHLRRRVAVAEPLGVMGTSLGAVAAWHAAWSYPETFSRMLLQSGTFAFDPHEELPGEMFRSISRFVTAATADVRLRDARVYQSCGRYESLIDWNRQVAAALADAHLDARYVESWTGHDWGSWRDHLEPGLRFLYPPSTREAG